MKYRSLASPKENILFLFFKYLAVSSFAWFKSRCLRKIFTCAERVGNLLIMIIYKNI